MQKLQNGKEESDRGGQLKPGPSTRLASKRRSVYFVVLQRGAKRGGNLRKKKIRGGL